MRTKRVLIAGAMAVAGLALSATPASAGHDHYVMTPTASATRWRPGRPASPIPITAGTTGTTTTFTWERRNP